MQCSTRFPIRVLSFLPLASYPPAMRRRTYLFALVSFILIVIFRDHLPSLQPPRLISPSEATLNDHPTLRSSHLPQIQYDFSASNPGADPAHLIAIKAEFIHAYNGLQIALLAP